MARNDENLQLKITLEGFHPPVWRRIIVPGNMTLADLHTVIQIAFDWDDAHLHDFHETRALKRHYGPASDSDLANQVSEDKISVQSIITQSNLIYTYDFGDDWRHLIHLEDVLTMSGSQQITGPYCVTGRGASRLEDSRGEEDGEGAPFNKDRINSRLTAQFNANQQQTKQSQKVVLFPKQDQEEEAALELDLDPDHQEVDNFLKDNPEIVQSILNHRPLSKENQDKLGQFMIKQAINQDESHTTPITDADLTQRLTEISAKAPKAQHEAYQIIQAARLTEEQVKHVVQTILDNELVLSHVTDEAEHWIATRTHAAGLLENMLNRDEISEMVSNAILTVQQRRQIFDVATQYARKERVMLPVGWNDDLPPLSAALTLLGTAVNNDHYPKQRLTELAPTLISVFNNMHTPFYGTESETILNMLLELEESPQLTNAEFIKIIGSVADPVFYQPKSSPLQTMRARSWVQILLPLVLAIQGDPELDWLISDTLFKQVDDFYASQGVMLNRSLDY
ncbi:plasmid pRiA4b ORF-3 family protein [Agrilactobacillus fermenti]|uniref:plasmid pRiA4b ORF-3 family protein n=1 Tax=Agrilactobacillus fermenti TaxID=2586909 RepID=UPI001E3F0BA0|nr:plasmid pRiA4b ORF-3 family protein [Agrilactobacillus fermenti]MCD2255741.1 plasmid pRiA4b ORF-3 family protein [Agrilactobacillus fermenti]